MRRALVAVAVMVMLAGCRPLPTGTSVREIDAATAAVMTGVSWRPGCPVPLSDLRVLEVPYRGMDGRDHRGRLIVHREVAEPVARVMVRLFEAGFPIERMEPVDAFGGSDDASMAANNTSAFNCRRITGGTSWSRHAYGRAIDINPVQNPYVSGSVVLPPAGAAHVDRRRVQPGMIVKGDVVTEAFAGVGWRWGGDWRNPDYQHFEHRPK